MSDIQCTCKWNPDRHDDDCPVSLRQQLDQKQADLDRALARVAELTEMFAQGFDADGDLDEWRERAMKSVAGGLPSGKAFIKRQQAYAVEDWLHGDADMGDLEDYATRLRQQADQLENTHD